MAPQTTNSHWLDSYSVDQIGSQNKLPQKYSQRELDLYRAHTPRAHCAMYRSAFVAAWLYQELIDPISPWLYDIELLVISAKTRYQQKHY